ncbi:MAG: phosphoenolpyruvate carboxykinase (ATP) [Candidatus Zixiibacteriota bacterium]|nr:MAG: phosphoenolpyruvate carboxykinase (ATP) [candidate division Zixibacteria bacterium]
MPVKRLISKYGLENHGLTNVGKVHWNHNTPMLYEDIIRNGEGHLMHLGPIAVRTGLHTGRAAKEKFIVEESGSQDQVWWGKVNKPFPQDKFDMMFRRLEAYLQGRPLYVQDCYGGHDSRYRLPVRVITETAWHSLFARTMLIQARWEELEKHVPQFTVLHVPNFHAIPEIDGTHSEAFILLNLSKKLVLIGGTAYGGEIKKSVFTVLNYLLPQKNVLSMHCSANCGPDGDSALFFGLSGTGKTTLSADPKRQLVGDDEHGWSADGIFNFEGGCYAKVIRLDHEAEPEIYATTRRFATILENVGFDPITRRIDLDDDSLTENTRAAYPLGHIPNIVKDGKAGHPRNVIMLTADAFGVMPPISKLTPEQAMYHFISGYTAKVAGTEAGITEPEATFSACFGAPFMVLHPSRYAELLAERIREHKVDCWLVNTGWSGGPYGVGKRMKIKYTRALLNAALDGSLAKVDYEEDPIFGVQVPTECPGVPKKILKPRNTWKDKEAYDKKAEHLAGLFVENFRQFEDQASEEVKAAGPMQAVTAG